MTTQPTYDRPQAGEEPQSAHAGATVGRPTADRATTATEMELASPQMLKVSSNSRPAALAGAIANIIRAHGIAEVQAIGAGAINQGVKAIAVARAYLTEDSIEIIFRPSFLDLVIGGEERTGMRLLIERR